MPVKINLIIQLCLLLSYAHKPKSHLAFVRSPYGSPISIGMYLSSFPSIAVSLKRNVAHASYPLTSYFAGVCVGQLQYGIIIDCFWQKKAVGHRYQD